MVRGRCKAETCEGDRMKFLSMLVATMLFVGIPGAASAETDPPPIEWTTGRRGCGHAELLTSPDEATVYLSLAGSSTYCTERAFGIAAFDAGDGSRTWIRRSLPELDRFTIESAAVHRDE